MDFPLPDCPTYKFKESVIVSKVEKKNSSRKVKVGKPQTIKRDKGEEERVFGNA